MMTVALEKNDLSCRTMRVRTATMRMRIIQVEEQCANTIATMQNAQIQLQNARMQRGIVQHLI